MFGRDRRRLPRQSREARHYHQLGAASAAHSARRRAARSPASRRQHQPDRRHATAADRSRPRSRPCRVLEPASAPRAKVSPDPDRARASSHPNQRAASKRFWGRHRRRRQSPAHREAERCARPPTASGQSGRWGRHRRAGRRVGHRRGGRRQLGLPGTDRCRAGHAALPWQRQESHGPTRRRCRDSCMRAADGLGTRNVPPSARGIATATTTNEIAVRHDLGSIGR